MATITASLVKELREETGVGMMQCKSALVETNGDKAAAIKILRERGVAVAAKRAARTANQGIIAASVCPEGQQAGTMIEVNCETDFVAKNDTFKAFVDELLVDARELADNTLAEVAKAKVEKAISEIGENIVARRNVSLKVQGTGAVASYVHMGGKFGVLVEISCKKPETIQADAFKALSADLALHITAAAPQYVCRSEVPADVVSAEREIYAKQVEGKPANIVDKIVDGKLDKFYGQICLIEQEFVKDSAQTITDVLTAAGKALDDEVTVARFVRWQLGA